MNANQIYAYLRSGQFRQAFDELRQDWRFLRWEIRSAIVNAWKIQDRASATLMFRFYRHLLSARKPSLAAALRWAQLQVWRDREFAAPYFWAGFVLQGEWK